MTLNPLTLMLETVHCPCLSSPYPISPRVTQQILYKHSVLVWSSETDTIPSAHLDWTCLTGLRVFCRSQEAIPRDSGSGWTLGPDLDHFSNRTRHALQYMNPHKLNMDLTVELLAYLGEKEQQTPDRLPLSIILNTLGSK